MGIFKIFKELRAFHKMMKELPQQIEQEIERQHEAYGSMTPEEMAALPDDELFSAAQCRINAVTDRLEDTQAEFGALSEHQKVVYAVNLFEMEVNNGGLCQFFVNSSRVVAPYISDYLGLIGATEHKQLFDGFISKYRIDLNDLSSFQIRRVKDFEKQTKRYPFDEYDDRFYELESLEIPLTAYIRAHVDAF